MRRIRRYSCWISAAPSSPDCWNWPSPWRSPCSSTICFRRATAPLILAAAAGLLVLYLMNTGLMAIVTYWGHMLGINIETEMRRRAL